MAKDKANKGWIKELSSKPKPNPKPKPFDYSKPVSKVDKPNGMAVNHRSREYKPVKQDKNTNFAMEQKQAKQSHKGIK